MISASGKTPDGTQHDFRLTFRPLPSGYEPMNRLKRFLKNGLRSFRLRCIGMEFIPMEKGPKPSAIPLCEDEHGDQNDLRADMLALESQLRMLLLIYRRPQYQKACDCLNQAMRHLEGAMG